MARRVVITGIGVISALGLTRDAFWSGLATGSSGIRPMKLVPEGSVKFTQGAEVPGFRATEYFDEKDVDMLDRFAQFAAIAAREAIADSGLKWNGDLAARTAIVTGSSTGGQTTEDSGFRNLYSLNGRVHPLTIPRIMINAAASRVSFEHGITGPAFAISTACSSANHAIGQAFWMVRNGAAEVAIAGGSEAPFSTGFLKAWEAMRVVSPDTCRPFSKDRHGLILGEGAGMLVLEPLERAQARGARIWGEIAGFGMSSDAHHITHPLAEGAVRAIHSALLDAGMNGSVSSFAGKSGGLSPEAIDYINAHGTGTVVSDATETEAIRTVFGTHASKLMVSSTKSMHGHALGAAGALEAAATLLALYNGIIPPTANFTESDPLCDLDVVPNTARAATAEWAMSNSFAFGGLNAVLVFRKIDRGGGTPA